MNGYDLIGMKLYGYCHGYFGRDSYWEKTIEGYGRDWIVARDEHSGIVIATFRNVEERDDYIKHWMSDEYIKEWSNR